MRIPIFFYDYLALLGTMQNQHFFSQKQTEKMLGWIKEIVDDGSMGGTTAPAEKKSASKDLEAEITKLKKRLAKYEDLDVEPAKGSAKGKTKSKAKGKVAPEPVEEPPPRMRDAKGKGKGGKGKGKGKALVDDYEEPLPFKGKGKGKGKGS